jgi:hypothetical protein
MPKRTREAMSLDEKRQRVGDKIRDQFGAGQEYGPYIEDLYDAFAIVREEDADYFRVDYAIDAEGNVTLGEKVAVRKEYVPIQILASLREAEGGNGRTFDVVVLAAGKSANQIDGRHIYYSPEILEESAAIFEGTPVNAHRIGEEFDHVDGVDKTDYSLNTVGVLEGVHFGEGAIRGRLVLHEGADFIAGLLKLSIERDQPLVGLSIDALGSVDFITHEGEEVAAVTTLRGPASVDIVSRPAAGGEIVRLAASMRGVESMSEPEKKPENGDAPKPASKVVATDPPVAEPVDLDKFKESITDDVRKKALEQVEEELAKKREEFEKELREAEARQTLLSTKLRESNLADDAQALVREKFESGTFTEEEVDERIAQVRKLVASRDGTGAVIVPGGRIELGLELRDKAEVRLFEMFMRNSLESTRLEAEKQLREAGQDPIWSLHKFLRETYGVDLTDAVGSRKERMKLTESLATTDWTDVFGDVMNKALLAAYRDNDWTDWRKIVSIVPAKDFMTKHAIRLGGYGNLPAVAQGANYTAMTSPGDEEQEYTPAKYGGTEDLTREMLLADDVGAISRIPSGLAYAAARTLYEYIFDLLTIAGQPTMDYDSTALFATSRATNDNLGTTALAAAEVIVVWKAMQKFTELTSAKRAAIRPKFLLVPVDLANTAYDIVKPLAEFPGGSTTDNEFIRRFGIEVIVVAHWTNAKDHVYVADPALVPGFQMAFIGGRQEPELFVQDNQAFGSVFDRDAITYKIRHEYGGSPVDHRAFYAEDVA